jgi:class 3 adenylate cyclase
MMPLSPLEKRLHGSLRGRITREFFSNSAHFPIVLILLELLLKGPWTYLSEPDVYALLAAAAFQAYWIGQREYRGQPSPLWGNLLAPTLYTLAEILLEFNQMSLEKDVEKFFSAPHHIAFWFFALGMGLLQSLRRRAGVIFKAILLILENLARTLILAVMYFIFELLANGGTEISFYWFLHDPSHIFITLSLLFIGLLLGAAHYNAEVFLDCLYATNKQLHTYSTWLLGKQLLDTAVRNPASLSLQRRERTVVFMDIRGFTAWSEAQPPEQVVDMLNRYFAVAETCWTRPEVMPQLSKVKLTGDEVMLVFANVDAALATARCLRAQIGELLKSYRLDVGIGLHHGPLVEGLLGSREVRAYDIIGDTVNTAKRICDRAAGGEVLLSRTAYDHLENPPTVGPMYEARVKGKSEALELLPLL